MIIFSLFLADLAGDWDPVYCRLILFQQNHKMDQSIFMLPLRDKGANTSLREKKYATCFMVHQIYINYGKI